MRILSIYIYESAQEQDSIKILQDLKRFVCETIEFAQNPNTGNPRCGTAEALWNYYADSIGFDTGLCWMLCWGPLKKPSNLYRIRTLEALDAAQRKLDCLWTLWCPEHLLQRRHGEFQCDGTREPTCQYPLCCGSLYSVLFFRIINRILDRMLDRILYRILESILHITIGFSMGFLGPRCGAVPS